MYYFSGGVTPSEEKFEELKTEKKGESGEGGPKKVDTFRFLVTSFKCYGDELSGRSCPSQPLTPRRRCDAICVASR